MSNGVGKSVIGIVGGIGSGKSAVAAELARHGGLVLNADAYGHEALRQSDIIAKVRERWGTGVLNADGQVDRRRMAEIVFADPAERAALEGMVFPWIESRIREEIAKAQGDPAVPFLVLDAAIMFETGWNSVCDRIIFVDTPRPTRVQRLKLRQGWSEDEITRREAAQLPVEVKAARADTAVVNSGTLESLRSQVNALAGEWGLHKTT